MNYLKQFFPKKKTDLKIDHLKEGFPNLFPTVRDAYCSVEASLHFHAELVAGTLWSVAFMPGVPKCWAAGCWA